MNTAHRPTGAVRFPAPVLAVQNDKNEGLLSATLVKTRITMNRVRSEAFSSFRRQHGRRAQG